MPLNVPQGPRECLGESPIVATGPVHHDGGVTTEQTDLDQLDHTPTPTRLERPTTGRWIAGVARGLSDYWGIPVWAMRLGFLILLPIGGLGLLLYAIGWAFLPAANDAEPPVAQLVVVLRDRQAWLGTALVAVAVVIIVSSLNIIDDGLIWAGALLVLGFLLYRGDLEGMSAPPGRAAPPPTASFDDEPWEVEQVEVALPDVEPLSDGGDAEPPPAPPVGRPPRRKRPPREPSYLGRLTLAAVLITIGVMVAFDVSGITHPTTRHYFAAPVLVIGIGLLVGAFIGRSRGLIVLGVLLVPVALAGSLLDIRFDDDFGDVDVFAESVADLEPSYRVAGGAVYLDLRQLELDGEDVAIEAEVGGGSVYVALPPQYAVEIDGRVRLGRLDVLGRSSNGFDLNRLTSRSGTGGTIRLDLDVGIGEVEVRDYNPFYGRFADPLPAIQIRPQSIEELAPSYFVPGGVVELDLRALSSLPAEVGGSGFDVEAIVGRGDLLVYLPPWLDVNVVARTGAGVLDIVGSQMVGENLVDEAAIAGAGGPPLNLFLTTDEGSVIVEIHS